MNEFPLRSVQVPRDLFEAENSLVPEQLGTCVPSVLLQDFQSFRELAPADQKKFSLFWERFNEPSEDSIRNEDDLARREVSISSSPDFRMHSGLLSLHHGMRIALASERFIPDGGTVSAEGVRYVLADRDLAVRDGVILIRHDEAVEATNQFHRTLKHLSPEERKAIIQMICEIYLIQKLKGQEKASYDVFVAQAKKIFPQSSLETRNVLFSIYRLFIKRPEMIEASLEDLDPQGLAYLIRSNRFMLRLSQSEMAFKLGMTRESLWRLERDPQEGDVRIPGRSLLGKLVVKNIYGLPVAAVLRAHWYFWRRHEVAKLFASPVFLRSEKDAREVLAYVRDFVTPGRILYAWRNGDNSDIADLIFMPTRDEMAHFLRVPEVLYQRWETDIQLLTREDVEKIGRRLQKTEVEVESLWSAVEKMRVNHRNAGRPNPTVSLPHFTRLIDGRDTLGLRTVAEMKGRLLEMGVENPVSVEWVETQAAKILDPYSQDCLRLVEAVHVAARRLKRWPFQFLLEGPLVAFYFFHWSHAKKLDAFKSILKGRRMGRIQIDPESGDYKKSIYEGQKNNLGSPADY